MPAAEGSAMSKELRLFVCVLAVGLIFLTTKPLHAILLAIAAIVILCPRLIWWQ